MEKRYLIELMLFLNEIKASNEINKKYNRDIDRYINFLTSIVENSDNVEKIKKSKSKLSILVKIVEIIINFINPP